MKDILIEIQKGKLNKHRVHIYTCKTRRKKTCLNCHQLTCISLPGGH